MVEVLDMDLFDVTATLRRHTRMLVGELQESRWIAAPDLIGGNILGDDAAAAHDGALVDRHPGSDPGVTAD